MIKHSEEFEQEAVRIALTSGLPQDRVASDLGIEKSTLGKWLTQYRPTDLMPAPQADLARENERLRLENRVLREGGRRAAMPGAPSTGLRRAAPCTDTSATRQYDSGDEISCDCRSNAS